MERRAFLRGLAGCFAAAAAPGVIGSGVLMPIRKIVVPDPFGQYGFIPVEFYAGRIPFEGEIGSVNGMRLYSSYDDHRMDAARYQVGPDVVSKATINRAIAKLKAQTDIVRPVDGGYVMFLAPDYAADWRRELRGPA